MSASASRLWGLPTRTAVRVGLALALSSSFVLWLELGMNGFVTGALLALAPVPVYVALALWLDRYDPEPARLLAKTFAWGAVVAAFFGMLLNEWVAFSTGSDLLVSVFTAPIGEELLKGAALLLLFHLHRHDFDNVTDGVVYATMVGLGFATMENIYYYGQAVLDGMTDAVFLLRGTISPFAHPLFTAMTGIGIGWARESSDPVVRAVAPVGGLALAIGMHSAWNVSIEADAFFPVYLLTMVPAFFAVLLVVRRSLRREEAMLREYLKPQLAVGLLSEAQLDAICSRSHRLWIVRPASIADRNGRATEESLHRAAVALAFRRWRSARAPVADESVGDPEEAYLERLRRISAALAAEGRTPVPG